MSEPLIHARGLSKVYRMYPSPWARLWEALSGRQRHRPYPALQDVTFDLQAGEGLALIGENGAGKSTLLKILAGVTPASSGVAQVRGQVASILELGSGFHPELSGRQNIVLQAAMLGLSDREVRERTPAIIEFSELGAFIDQPVKSYSTGMAMRLGFAIATQVEPDVLIIDEALSVGDGYFQKKCMDLMLGFLDNGGTLLFCSHAMYYVAAFCRRALWLRDGRMEALGPAEGVIRDYETYLLAKNRAAAEAPGPEPAADPEAAHREVGPARLHAVEPLLDGGAGSNGAFRRGDWWSLDVAWESDDPGRRFHLAVGIDRVDDVQVLVLSTHHEGVAPWTGETRYRARLEIPELPMLSGSFNIQVYLLDEAALHVYDQRKLRHALEVEARGYQLGLVETEHAWIRDARS